MKNKDQNIKNVGYDWTLTFNQVAAMNAGLLGKIKGDEILIFESFIKFGTWQGCEKVVRENKIFYHYEWKKVVQRLPFLGLNSRSPIKKRFQNLVDIGLLIPHPNNETMCKSYYAFGALYDVYSNRNPSSTKDGTRPQRRTGRPQRRTGASSTKDGGVLNEGRYPSSDKDAMMYNNDNTNDLNNDFFLKEKFEKYKILKHNWNNWKTYLKETHNVELTPQREKDQFEHLINCGEEDPKIMAQIITQARSGEFKMFIPLQGRKNKIRQNDFPNGWDPVFFKKLDPEFFPKYYKHLRQLGFKPVRHNGQIIKWAIPQKETV
jgi:hypothetical protein